jgi:hypothetical protein
VCHEPRRLQQTQSKILTIFPTQQQNKKMDHLLKDIKPIEIIAGYNAKSIHIAKCFKRPVSCATNQGVVQTTALPIIKKN